MRDADVAEAIPHDAHAHIPADGWAVRALARCGANKGREGDSSLVRLSITREREVEREVERSREVEREVERSREVER